MSRALRLSLLVSLLLHLAAVWVADRVLVGRQDERFRARLTVAPRFTPPPRPPVPRPSMPTVTMEYRRAEAAAGVPETPAAALPTPAAVDDIEAPDLDDTTPVVATKGLQLAREAMPEVGRVPGADTLASRSLDLVRIEDLIRADGERAVVLPDADSVRATRGFIKFTPLYLNGVWSYAMSDEGSGRPVPEDLAGFLRDHTGIHAEIRSTPARAFLSDQLLRDPVHFWFPGPSSRAEPRIELAAEERQLLRRYLLEGGFLFVDAHRDSHFFLNTTVDILHEILGKDGRLVELPADHPIYHAFYDYPEGFPGECDKVIRQMPFDRPWYYPPPSLALTCPRGLYAIEVDGRLAGIISDLNLHMGWVPQVTTEELVGDDGEVEGTIPFLQAGTNVLFYALLRPEGLTVKHSPPAWERTTPSATARRDTAWWVREAARQAGDVPVVGPGDLALVRAPVGRDLDGEALRVRVDGRWTLEVLAGHANGALIRGLPPGRHRIRVDYGGEQETMDVDVRAWRVTTVSFRLRGLGFLRSLSLEPQPQRLLLKTWRDTFPALTLEEAQWTAPE